MAVMAVGAVMVVVPVEYGRVGNGGRGIGW